MGLVVGPLLPEPQPAALNTRNSARVPSGIRARDLRLRAASKSANERASASEALGHKLMWKGLPPDEGGMAARVREVVEITSEALEECATVTAPQLAPVGKPVHVSA